MDFHNQLYLKKFYVRIRFYYLKDRLTGVELSQVAKGINAKCTNGVQVFQFNANFCLFILKTFMLRCVDVTNNEFNLSRNLTLFSSYCNITLGREKKMSKTYENDVKWVFNQNDILARENIPPQVTLNSNLDFGIKGNCIILQ